jgi:hypothetical protein
MRECRSYGSARGAGSDARPYRDLWAHSEHGMIRRRGSARDRHEAKQFGPMTACPGNGRAKEARQAHPRLRFGADPRAKGPVLLRTNATPVDFFDRVYSATTTGIG